MMTDSMLDTQVRSLVGHIRQRHSRELGKELEKARQTAARLTAQAHKDSRLAVHRAIRRSREALSRADQRTQAALSTRRRQDRQRESQALLQQAWPLLENAVRQRWQSASKRQGWWREAIEQSSRLLLGKEWIIEHATHWPEAEQREAAGLARRLGATPCTFRPDPGIVAGLRIRSGPSCCDCTDRGLLRDKLWINARLCSNLVVPDTATATGEGEEAG